MLRKEHCLFPTQMHKNANIESMALIDEA